jgi:predicted ATPase/class 3 adenylate cyclase
VVGDALPQGTVTFLFTDIEGSTRLLRHLGDRYMPLLERHYELIRSAIAAHGGREVKTEGDAVFAAFPDAPGAARACLAAQLALQDEHWPDDGVIRVRMGLHTGHAIPIADDYVALAVHQAARVAAAPHGDQVVASATTVALAGDLPAPATWRDLGRFALRDFDGPERLFQIVHPDLATDFPALRAQAAIRHNLPPPRTTFVGRSEEQRTVSLLLEENTIVTVVGAGGAGKTRLATHIALDAVPTFPDGAWLVELAPVRDPAFVVHAVMDVLGLKPQSGENVAETLVLHLKTKNLLLVLDNCEHVVNEAAALADNLLTRCPHVKIVATSREPLNVSGEVSWRLPSLGATDGAQLFVERGRSANPSLEIDDAAGRAIDSIVHRLDGIPLAIELAASRLRALTVDQIAQRLDDRFSLLAGGPRTALPRQQTLRAAIDWSYDLLSSDEQTLFRQLAVFVDGFTLDAAEMLGETAATPVFDALQSLVDKSLVVSGDGRFRMLETVRHYARERLVDSGDARETQRRFATWAIALLAQHAAAYEEEAGSELSEAELARRAPVEAEHDNLLAALDAAVSSAVNDAAWTIARPLSEVWWKSARNHLGLDRIDTMSDLPGPDGLRYETFFFAQELAFAIKDWARMAAYCDRASELREQGDAADVAGLVFHRALAADALGDLPAALDGYCRALEMAQDSGDTYRQSVQYAALGHFAAAAGSFDLAAQLEQRAIAAAATNRRQLSQSLLGKAGRLFQIGELDRAEEALHECLDAAAGTPIETYAMVWSAAVWVTRGNPERAQAVVSGAAALSRARHDVLGIVDALKVLARIRREVGDADGALALLEEATALVQQIGHRASEVDGRARYAEALVDVGRIDEAQAEATDGVALVRSIGDRHVLPRALTVAAHAALAAGDSDGARRFATEAVEVASFHGLNTTPLALAALADALEDTDLASAVMFDAARARWQEEFAVFVWPVDRAREQASALRRRGALGEEPAAIQLAAGRDHPLFDSIVNQRRQIEAAGWSALERAPGIAPA